MTVVACYQALSTFLFRFVPFWQNLFGTDLGVFHANGYFMKKLRINVEELQPSYFPPFHFRTDVFPKDENNSFSSKSTPFSSVFPFFSTFIVRDFC